MRGLSLGQVIGLALVVPVIVLSMVATWRGLQRLLSDEHVAMIRQFIADNTATLVTKEG